ncbi:MAG: DUF2723 domain-containing protein [Muribaculaceae bacterium]|nr:DUF2723 domain-containing protein [Muribaculaceae bacterium]
MITKKYNLVNNVGGWIVFAIALVTYWLTLEPTASYWDCGEFIIQADKLEVGHPPGNPIFMLTARFFANFAPDAQHVSLMVNAMSGLLSALTILLLFWTISHLVRRLIVGNPDYSVGAIPAPVADCSQVSKGNAELSLWQYLVIMGSAAVGSLAYCWSDTFWFSAVEGEVYAFSSFCTALVFWLILKWENRADNPGADRYLVLIAYIIGVSVAVHLLNLLCIPAIVLVYVYRKYQNMNLVKSLLALVVSFVIIFLVLYGLVPGFIKVAQQFELLFVNSFHAPFNTGAIVYAFVALVVFGFALYEIGASRSDKVARLGFLLAITISGMLFIGDSAWVGWVLTALLAAYLFTKFGRSLSRRVMSVIMWSVAMIFVGYSSYALILIRSSADTPMNQNSPDNVFDLASYLNREQYGETPLLYGETMYSSPQRIVGDYDSENLGEWPDGTPATLLRPRYIGSVVDGGKPLYAKGVEGAEPHSEYNLLSVSEQQRNAELAHRGGDYYVMKDHKPEAKMNPELNMLFPRLYSRQHASLYANWVRLDTLPDQLVAISAIDSRTGEEVPELNISGQPEINQMTQSVYYPQKYAFKPSFAQNLAYFFNYQLNHMYLRYFMWNFAGRQNDVLNQAGELDAGNWVSGIPFIDNPRLGDQSLLPDDLGRDNPGHNVYFMLPLILGLIGLVWQSFAGKRGIEQFWVVFFLFFMTGIAIVLYLNQTPGQPRERDYAFAGSFYAYAIWIGMGVAGLYAIVAGRLRNQKQRTVAAGAAVVLGLVIPVQMVSQTWDDHDRSGRYAARDYAINYLESLEPNAIVFCNGDNDTFPLWYAQEVEGVRPDVRIINLSYLTSDWYANQQRMQSYEGAPVDFTSTPDQIAYGLMDVTVLPYANESPADLLSSLKLLFEGKTIDEGSGYRQLASSVVKIPVDKEAVVARGLVAPKDTADIVDEIVVDLGNTTAYRKKGYLALGEVLMLDIIATNAAKGWPRPIYWCSTVGDEYHLGLTDYLRTTGMTHQLVPTMQAGKAARTDRAYPVITQKYRFGGADAEGHTPYFDETARRMLFSVRNSIVETASQLLYEGDRYLAAGDTAAARREYARSVELLDIMMSRTPERVGRIDMYLGLTTAQIYCEIGKEIGDKALTAKGLSLLEHLMEQYAQYTRYNAMMVSLFYSPSLTYDSKLAPYQYYRMVELFEEYGGDKKRCEQLIALTGLDRETLRKYYDLYTSPSMGASGASQGELSAADAADELSKYCEIANHLSTLPAAEYSAASDDERYIDSMLYALLEQFEPEQETLRLLQANEHWQRLDRERSRRLFEEFKANHPEMYQ